MEEKVLIEGCISQKSKNIFKWIIVALLIISAISLIVVIQEGKEMFLGWHSHTYRESRYQCDRCYKIGDFYEMLDHLSEVHNYSFSIVYAFNVLYYNPLVLILHWAFILFAIIFSLIYLSVSRSHIMITNENISGRTFWGKKVVLPIHMVSSYSISKFFSIIAVSSASGFVKFPFIENYEEIGSVLQKLLNERQKNTETNKTLFLNKNNSNNLDDLKKLKELLDNGIISQEEFETKKKQLLGI